MRSRGFTLIELLIVVAIISLLISILMPSLGQARAQARRSVCAAHLYQVGVAIYSYWNEWNGRVPCVEGPLVNPLFGNPATPDSQMDPFDRQRWPMSLPNVLMPQYVADAGVFVCPSALTGWPRYSKPLRYTYRDAGRNQPRGAVEPLESYLREHFGFMDGRMLRKFRMDLRVDSTSPTDVIHNAQEYAKSRGVFLRDLVTPERPGGRLIGPHAGGILTLNRDLQVEYRNQQVTNDDLAPSEASGSTF